MKRSGEEELNLRMDEAVTMKEEIFKMENRNGCFIIFVFFLINGS